MFGRLYVFDVASVAVRQSSSSLSGFHIASPSLMQYAYLKNESPNVRCFRLDVGGMYYTGRNFYLTAIADVPLSSFQRVRNFSCIGLTSNTPELDKVAQRVFSHLSAVLKSDCWWSPDEVDVAATKAW